MEKLNVPENISLRWELWRGFGKKELVITSIVLAVSIVLAWLYTQISSSQIASVQAVGGVVVALFITISMLNKIEYNQSLVDYIKKCLRYRKEQQRFEYKNEEVITPYVKKED